MNDRSSPRRDGLHVQGVEIFEVHGRDPYLEDLRCGHGGDDYTGSGYCQGSRDCHRERAGGEARIKVWRESKGEEGGEKIKIRKYSTQREE